MPELREFTCGCFGLHHSSPELELLQPSWFSSQYSSRWSSVLSSSLIQQPLSILCAFSSIRYVFFALCNRQDIAPQCAGFLHGIANCAGTFAAIISTIGTGYFVQWLGSFQAFLSVTAGLYFITAIFWNLFATGERVI